jgi:peptide/nickel transport system substrate-binding protein
MKLKLAYFLATALIALPGFAIAQDKGGVINVATIGEPPTLDPMVSTADLVGIVTQHMFETLYTFDKNWNVTPLLADKLPEVSADGKVYTIKLRSDIKFHDGSVMTSKDVVASLNRWVKLASRGKQAGMFMDNVKASDPSTQAALCASGLSAGIQ